MSSADASTKRFIDRGAGLFDYLTPHIDVLCHRCRKPARIQMTVEQAGQRDGHRWYWQASFRCGHCAAMLDRRDTAAAPGDPETWKGPWNAFGKIACKQCGHRWLNAWRLGLPPEAKASTIDVPCPRCASVQAVPVEHSPSHPIGAALDPVFGMALSLRRPVAGLGEVWVYNHRHLADLEAYVSSPLRQRGSSRNDSYFNRLPAWIKQARHRDAVLKAIARIEQNDE